MFLWASSKSTMQLSAIVDALAAQLHFLAHPHPFISFTLPYTSLPNFPYWKDAEVFYTYLTALPLKLKSNVLVGSLL